MPDRQREVPVIEGRVSETSHSDSFLEKDVVERDAEYYALTGKPIIRRIVSEVEQQVLKPGSFTSQQRQASEEIAMPESLTFSNDVTSAPSKIIPPATGNEGGRFPVSLAEYRQARKAQRSRKLAA